ncbi:MAG TPA: methyltransferase domain-containing protein [Solirubrobacteraceae bacterium]|jgi:SAM-dependent methyltransferase|nr:methyltransferase domain-containing protein [Solirubrobacteraceae bacterium]
MTATEVIWHDLECGGYREDLPLWRALAREHPGPILEVGAGTGRVSVDLARLGHDVSALDRDRELLAALGARAAGTTLTTVVADARSFALDRRFALCLVPMQAIQLLGGVRERASFLRCARACLMAGGVLAAALTDDVDPYEVTAGAPAPLPDIRELDGIVYASRPIAVREEDDVFVIERRREIVAPNGAHAVEENRIALDRVGAAELEREGCLAGFHPLLRAHVPATADYVGSEVVMLAA